MYFFVPCLLRDSENEEFMPGELNYINYAVHRTIAIIPNSPVEGLSFLLTPEG